MNRNACDARESWASWTGRLESRGPRAALHQVPTSCIHLFILTPLVAKQRLRQRLHLCPSCPFQTRLCKRYGRHTSPGPHTDSSTQLLQEVETQALVSQQKIQQTQAEINAKKRETRLNQLTSNELASLTPDTNVYEGVGKMYVQPTVIPCHPMGLTHVLGSSPSLRNTSTTACPPSRSRSRRISPNWKKGCITKRQPSRTAANT